MKTNKLILLLLCITLLALPVHAQDNLTSDEAPYFCPYSGGAYYQPDVFPRYDAATRSLVLVNSSGETVRVLDVIEENVRIINWSPDCHYLTGAVGLLRYPLDIPSPYVYRGQVVVRWYHKDIVIWDATTGTRIQTFKDNPGRYLASAAQTSVIWRSDSAYALILGGISERYKRIHEDYIWNSSANQFCRVGLLPENQWYPESRASFNQYYWDTAHGWLWGSGKGGVAVYDIITCEETQFFQLGAYLTWRESRFAFSPDSTFLAVYTVSQSEGGQGGITVYDLSSPDPIYVNAEGFAGHVALSADNRYLIAGYSAIRVWDLQNLPENYNDRLPIYRHGGPEALIWSIRFSSPGVIETTSEEGVQHWDLHTGAFVPGE